MLLQTGGNSPKRRGKKEGCRALEPFCGDFGSRVSISMCAFLVVNVAQTSLIGSESNCDCENT